MFKFFTSKYWKERKELRNKTHNNARFQDGVNFVDDAWNHNYTDGNHAKKVLKHLDASVTIYPLPDDYFDKGARSRIDELMAETGLGSY